MKKLPERIIVFSKKQEKKGTSTVQVLSTRVQHQELAWSVSQKEEFLFTSAVKIIREM